MEEKIYQILKKHKLPLKKREELIVDLLGLFSVSDSIRTDVNGEIHKSDEYIDGDQDCNKCKYYNTKADLPPCSGCELGESEYYR